MFCECANVYNGVAYVRARLDEALSFWVWIKLAGQAEMLGRYEGGRNGTQDDPSGNRRLPPRWNLPDQKIKLSANFTKLNFDRAKSIIHLVEASFQPVHSQLQVGGAVGFARFVMTGS